MWKLFGPSELFRHASETRALPNSATPGACTAQLLIDIDLTAPTDIASARAAAPSSPILTLLSKITSSKIAPELWLASTSALPNAFDPALVILLLLKFNRFKQPGLDERARASASAPTSPTPHDDISNSSNTHVSSPSLSIANLSAAANATAPASPMASFPPIRRTDGLYLRLLAPMCFLSNAFKIPLPICLQNAGPNPQFSNERVLGINAAPPPSNSFLAEFNSWTLGGWIPWPPISLNDKSTSSIRNSGTFAIWEP
mmetsp:Transcript_55498/g.118026  ORF Transcript_55498/g.118026 Transcript_55498/m.118026 type:complete len:258 (+) Transcript_55498:853-1626(+)